MSRKKKNLILTAVVILAAVWLFHGRSLMEVTKIDREKAEQCVVISHTKGDHRRAESEDAAVLQELFDMLENTEVRFDGWWVNVIRYDAREQLYHLEFYEKDWHPASETLSFCTNGQIYYGHFLYMLQGEDKQKCTNMLEKILTEYEVEV